MTSLLVVGSVALDSIETPFETREDILGGSASYFSVTASILTSVRLVAVVGDDFPKEHIEFLRSRNIDLKGLQQVPGRTFRWRGRYLQNLVDRETLDTQLNVFSAFKPTLPASFKDSEYVFLANINPELQLDVLKQVEHPRFVACDTMNFWILGQLNQLKAVLPKVQVLLLNDEEAHQLSGEHNLLHAASAIRQMGPSQVIIKRGDSGAILFDDSGIFWAPAFPLAKVVDPTGAGDCFAGGFISYLAFTNRIDSKNLRCAMIYGSAIASFCVEDFSLDRFRTLSRDDIQKRCKEFSELVRFDEINI